MLINKDGSSYSIIPSKLDSDVNGVLGNFNNDITDDFFINGTAVSMDTFFDAFE